MTIARRLLKRSRSERARAIRSRRVALGERTREAVANYLATLIFLPPGRTVVVWMERVMDGGYPHQARRPISSDLAGALGFAGPLSGGGQMVPASSLGSWVGSVG